MHIFAINMDAILSYGERRVRHCSMDGLLSYLSILPLICHSKWASLLSWTMLDFTMWRQIRFANIQITCDVKYIIHIWRQIHNSHMTSNIQFACDVKYTIRMWRQIYNFYVTSNTICMRRHIWRHIYNSHVTSNMQFTCDVTYIQFAFDVKCAICMQFYWFLMDLYLVEWIRSTLSGIKMHHLKWLSYSFFSRIRARWRTYLTTWKSLKSNQTTMLTYVTHWSKCPITSKPHHKTPTIQKVIYL